MTERPADAAAFTPGQIVTIRADSGLLALSADERDLISNLLPYWMGNYFKHPSYLKLDNRPLLFIYRPEFLIQDLGGEGNVAKAFDKMRQACREAGFDGLYILGEYRGLDANHLKLMKRLGKADPRALKRQLGIH